MPAIVVHQEDLGPLFEKNADNKLDLKLDNSGNVAFEKTDQGLKANVDIPPANVDVKLGGLTFENGKLKATLSDNSAVETDFTAEIVVAAIEQANEREKQRIADALKDAFLDALRGEELKDFAGATRGFLIRQ